jgi:hypothetical protein
MQLKLPSIALRGGEHDGKDNGDCENKGVCCQTLRRCGKKDYQSLQACQEKIGKEEKQ